MSTVELAVSKVKRLSSRQARELLDWLAERQRNGDVLEPQPRTARRKAKPRRSAQKLLAWNDAIRGTTNWQPPRMPDDLAKSVTRAYIKSLRGSLKGRGVMKALREDRKSAGM